jgi:hypothetical protein
MANNRGIPLPVTRRGLVLAVMLAYLLVSCSSSSIDDADRRPQYDNTGTTPGTVRALPPVIVTQEMGSVTAGVGDTVVLVLDDPGRWSVTVSPPAVAELIPRGQDEGYESNTALVVRATGRAEIRLAHDTGKVRLVQLTVVEPIGTVGDTVEARAASSALQIVGLDLDAARQRVEAVGLVLRIVRSDGQSLIVTEDYRIDRVNVTLEAGVVIAADIG